MHSESLALRRRPRLLLPLHGAPSRRRRHCPARRDDEQPRAAGEGRRGGGIRRERLETQGGRGQGGLEQGGHGVGFRRAW